VGGCVLVGLDYTYYAFFAVFVLLVATAIAVARDRRSRSWRHGLLLATAVVVATAVNLAPSLRLWAVNGKPLVIPAKTAAESELYGLKIRQLVSPVPDHPFPPFARWATLERRAAFPSDTENTSSRLGLLASIGFLALVGTLVVPRARPRTAAPEVFTAAAGLTLALVLLGTIGGFGSLFSLLISPEIRAYNRVCPFIAFFAWVAVAMWLDTFRPSRLWRAVILLGVFVFGVWDQIGALAPLNAAYAATRTEWTTVQSFVHELEPQVPRGAMVFQLPLTTYLNDENAGRMRTYDEIKPYLASSTLHWSYPALDNAVVRWQHAVARLPPRAMAEALRDAGFRAIVIDRAGSADGAESLVADLTLPGQAAPVLAEAPGYVALDLARVAASADDVVHLPVWTPAFDPASAGLPPCAAPLTAHIDSVGPLKAPASGPLTVEPASTYVIRGWAVDDANHALAGDVDLVVDDRPRATFYGVNRPDVALRASLPVYRYSGVLATVPAGDLPPGAHRFDFRVVSSDRGCASDVARLTVIVPPVF
jgi:phosphoglycerol transferase